MRRITSLTELRAKKAIKFSYRQEGISREGFVALFGGQVVAYENVCRHVPITLDYGDARFFNGEESHFVCQTHGATYEPLSGRCVLGGIAEAVGGGIAGRRNLVSGRALTLVLVVLKNDHSRCTQFIRRYETCKNPRASSEMLVRKWRLHLT